MRRVLNSHSRSRRRELLSLRTDSARCEGASVEVLGSWSISRSSTESVISSSGCDRAMAALDVQRLHRIEPADTLEQLLLFLRIRELLAGFHERRERVDHDFPVLPLIQLVVLDGRGDVVEKGLRDG